MCISVTFRRHKRQKDDLMKVLDLTGDEELNVTRENKPNFGLVMSVLNRNDHRGDKSSRWIKDLIKAPTELLEMPIAMFLRAML